MKLQFIAASGLWLLASPLAHALTDTNSNGLSDAWEKTFNNGQLFSAANPDHTPAADPDGDDWDNLREATAGTDPFDPLPPLGILAPAIGITPATFEPLPEGSAPSQQILLDPAEIRLTWPTIPGKTYQTFLSPDLLTWAPASGSYVGSGIHITTESEALHEDGTIPDELFWRVEAGDTDTDTDSDGDSIIDYEENLRGLNPLSIDTDGDGTADNLDLAPLVNSLQAVWDADSVNPSSAPLFAAFSFTPPATGVTAERVTDNSGNSRHGKARTQFGTTPSEQNAPQANAEGITNHGFRFDNAHHFAFDLVNPGINFAPVASLSFWLKTKAADLEGEGQPVFSYVHKLGVFAQNPNSSNPYAARAFLRKQPSGTGYEVVWLNWVAPGNIVRDRWILNLTATQIDERWINLTFVWQGAGDGQDKLWACYANGVRQTRTLGSTLRFQTSATTPNTPQDTFLIGADAAGGNGQNNLANVRATFKGTMDRVRMYSAALDQTQVDSIVKQDTDNDGLWDITETAATAWKDTNGNGRRDIGEIRYPNGSPILWQPPGTDSDRDGLTDILEQNNTRTDPYNHDSDNDLLPDGWETQYNLNPNSSTGIDGQSGNPDNDGLDNFQEWQHLTTPRLPDSDGDGVNDGPEITRASDPNSTADNGQAPRPMKPSLSASSSATPAPAIPSAGASRRPSWRAARSFFATPPVIMAKSPPPPNQPSTNSNPAKPTPFSSSTPVQIPTDSPLTQSDLRTPTTTGHCKSATKTPTAPSPT